MVETAGWLAPESPEEARKSYETLGPTARTVTREVAKPIVSNREEYREKVTEEVVETAHDALFASLLEVSDGSREEFETVFEDTTPHSYDHPTQFEESLPRQRGRQAIDGETSSVLAEAEAMTREMYETEEE